MKSISTLTKGIKNMKISKDDTHDQMDSESTSQEKPKLKTKSKEMPATKTKSVKNKEKVKEKDIVKTIETKVKVTETKAKAKPKTKKTIKVPPENDSLRRFYESLLKQNPASAMARKWCIDHGLLEE